MTSGRDEYAQWSRDDLVDRVMHLESQLRHRTDTATIDRSTEEATSTPTKGKEPKKPKTFDPSRYTTHHIALKLAYLGRQYNGFEHHINNTTSRTTIEEELWRALMKTRLIVPSPREMRNGQVEEGQGAAVVEDQQDHEGQVNWTGCDYSKCGRTDKGVSAFGQVVALRVRSNRPIRRVHTSGADAVETEEPADEAGQKTGETRAERPFDPIQDELDYPAILNRLLPPDIRILAWCPSPTSTFSARFSCKERRYKYFFTQPAFLPTPGVDEQGSFLDIESMRKATEFLLGSHDFRHFCKVDGSKQLTNFIRRITHASIDEVSSVDVPSFFNAPNFRTKDGSSQQMKVYAFSLHGTAFLWHQVRCIMAILFLVGQRHEAPEVIRDMLDMSRSDRGRPNYEMASEAPLVLWDCIFPLRPGDDDGKPYETGEHIEDAISWIYRSGRNAGNPMLDAGWGRNGLMSGLWQQWRERKMDELLAATLMDKAARPTEVTTPQDGVGKRSALVFAGGDVSRFVGKYVPIMKRPRMEPVEVINERFIMRKGLNGRASNVATDTDINE